MRGQARFTGLAGAAAVLLLTAAAPRPRAALDALREAATATDPLAPVLALVTLLAWALAGWLLSAVVATAGGHLPGQLGRGLASLARRIAPAALRRTIEVGFGLTVVMGALTSTAAADPGGVPPASGAGTTSLDWGGLSAGSALEPALAPGGHADLPPAAVPAGSASAPESSAPDASAPNLDWARPSTGVAPSPAGSPPAETVVVRPGDTLWDLAEADLRRRTGAPPADAQVAEAWPSWWTANREAVGADPHLLHPGTRLVPPAAT